MKRIFARATLSIAAIAGVVLPGASSTVQAQGSQDKPVVVVSVAPLKKLQGDINYILQATGFAEIGGFVSGAIDTYTAGINQEKPIGISVWLDENQAPVVLAFLPVDDAEAFFDPLKIFASSFEELEDGLMEIGFNGQTLYAQEEEGWLYLAQKEEVLDELPDDPMKLIEKMSSRYTIGVRANVENIPEGLRDMLMGQIKDAYERAMEQQAANQSAEEKAAAEAVGAQQIAQMERAMKETQNFVFGIAADKSKRNVGVDVGVQFVEGSQSDKQLAANAKLQTAFRGLENPEAAISLRMTQVVPPEEIASMKTTLDAAWNGGLKELEKNSKNPADVAVAKAFIQSLRENVDATLKEGVVDSGVAIDFENGLSFLSGARIADGNKFAKSVKDAISKSTGKDLPTIKFDAYKHKNVTFHVGSLAVPPQADEKARKIFGDKVQFVVGTADKAVYFALGKNCEKDLKDFLDKNEAKASVPNLIAAHLEAAQIVAYINEIDSNPVTEAMLKQLQKDASVDSILVNAKAVPHGAIYSITIEEGLLKAIGAGAKAAQGGR